MYKFLKLISFGNRYLVATCLYLGLGLLMVAVLPDRPKAYAGSGCGGEEPCGTNTECCDGSCCLEEGMICCGGKTCCDPEDCIDDKCGCDDE